MCGINVIVSEKKFTPIATMYEATIRRGPDGGAAVRSSNGKVTMAHNLLSITDLPEKSFQPWGKGNNLLVYNGEIYNHKDLRRTLKKTDWESDCDTEVLLTGLNEQGVDFASKLNGMYAFVWLNDNILYLVRDYCGMKPLYYRFNGDELYISSSVKSLLATGAPARINQDAYLILWHLGYIPGHLTLFDGIYKVCPNQVISYNLDTREVYKTFLKEQIHAVDFSKEEFLHNLSDSVQSTFLSGYRNIGLLLSGGVDSSSILHEVNKVCDKPKTFTTRFKCDAERNDERYNSDANIAKKFANSLGCEHHELYITFDDFMEAIPQSISVLEEPRCNRSCPAYYLMYKFMSENGIIVTLSGDGGDEIFTGYARDLKVKNGSVREWFDICTLNSNIAVSNEYCDFICSYVSATLDTNFNYPSPLNRYLYLSNITHLPEDFLIRNDQLAMNFGIEGRFPLINRKFRNYVLGIPPIWKKNKDIMFDSFRGILPDFIINKQKSGWSIPDFEWSIEIQKSDYWHYVHDDKNLVQFSNSLRDRGQKSLWLRFYFLAWAKEFNVSL